MAVTGPIVYVVQEQLYYDHSERQLKSRFDLSPARQYGQLRFLLPATASPHYPRQIVQELRQKLVGATAQDYLLLLGNPCLIGFATAVFAARTGGVVNLLQWHARERRYVLVQATHLLE